MTITNKVSLKSVMAGNTPIADVPDAPTIGAATNVGTSCAYNNGSATVAYTAAATGGTATTFTATSTPGSFTGTGSSPITVTGLQSATSYTFTVTPTNSTATGPASSSSSSITATTVPAAPTVGTPGSATTSSISVPFTAGATGGSAITSYTVTSSPSSITGTGSSSPIVVTGLASNTAYTFTVTATNANGTSAASSASSSVSTLSPYFLESVGTSTLTKNTVDSNGNIYAPFNSRGYLKLDSTGAVQFSTYLSNSYSNWQTTGVKVDSSANTYVSGCLASAGGGSPGENRTLVAKFDSSGSLQWIRGQYNGSATVANGIAIDSSGTYVAATGYLYNTSYSTYNSIFQRTSSDGSSSWGYYNSTSSNNSNSGATIDSSGNCYFGGAYTPSAQYATLYKFNSSGTLQWSNYYFPSSGNAAFYQLTNDSSGNVYASGYATNTGGLVAKINSSGTIQWSRILQGTTNCNLQQVALDSSGNVYAAGSIYTGSGYVGIIVKYNSSGTLQWQRSMTGPSSGAGYGTIFNGISVNSSGDLVLTGLHDADGAYTMRGFVATLPADGSKTGTYTLGSVSLVYATSSYTETSVSLSSNSMGGTITTNSVSDYTSAASSSLNYPSVNYKVTL